MYPSVSVIIPTFNRKNYISRALESVYAQSYTNILDVIVVDDGSTDGTQEHLKKRFKQISFVSQENKGVSAARNLGIQKAKGEWIAFLDSDDAWEKHKIKKQISALLKSEEQYLICHTDEIWIRKGVRVNSMKKHEKSGGWIFNRCLNLCLISPSSVLIHKRLFEKIGHFDEDLTVCEDYDLWLRITATFPVLYIPEKLTIKFGGHCDQLSKSEKGFDKYRAKSLIKLIKSGSLNPFQSQKAKETLEKKLTIYINGAKKRGNNSEAQIYESLLGNFT